MPKDKNPGMPVGSKKVPIIGQKFTEKDNEIINAAVKAIVERVEPILNGIGNMCEDLRQRVAVLEEVKQIFPSKVNVIVTHEKDGVFVPEKKEKKDLPVSKARFEAKEKK